MTVIGSLWTLLFAWVLTRRRLLFAYHRVIAGRLGLAASLLFTAGASLLAFTSPALREPAILAAALGGLLTLAAAMILQGALRRHRDLLQLRLWLEKNLTEGAC